MAVAFPALPPLLDKTLVEDAAEEVETAVPFATDVEAPFATDVDLALATEVEAAFATEVDAALATEVDLPLATEVDAAFATEVDAAFTADVDTTFTRAEVVAAATAAEDVSAMQESAGAASATWTSERAARTLSAKTRDDLLNIFGLIFLGSLIKGIGVDVN